MTTTQFTRAVRLPTPQFSVDELPVVLPPMIRRAPGGVSMLMPLLAIAATLGTGAVVWFTGASVGRNPMAFAFPGMMLISAIGMFVNASGRRGATELNDERLRYLEILDALADDLLKSSELHHASLIWAHPDPAALWTLIGSRRMWERNHSDSDFLQVRVGIGALPHCRKIVTPELPPVDDLDPVAAAYLHRFIEAHARTSDMPIPVNLSSFRVVDMCGELDGVRSLLRAMVCQLAAFHTPADLLIAAVVDGDSRADWEWLKWLPHNVDPSGSGPNIRNSLVFDTANNDTADNVEAELARCVAEGKPPHIVMVVDSGSDRCVSSLSKTGTTVLVARDPVARDPVARDEANELPSGALRLRLRGEQLSIAAGEGMTACADRMTITEARLFARRLSRHRHGADTAYGWQTWCAELGLNDLNPIDIRALWEPRGDRSRLAVPIGTSDHGEVVHLDIKEAANSGTGPHGLCIGATGSGKSELLRTVVIGMVTKHSPDELNFVLIDFKGGATFLGLERLNHVSAVITNLADEAHLVERMKDALAGEINRRQQLFRRAGNAANLADYHRVRQREALPPLPTLFIIVDEFAELLQHHSDFIDLFTAICRVGRSLGVHLLLASQRLDEGRLRGLESHLSYRICLKTLTASESRAVLGVGDAADLPRTPGSALLQTSDGKLTRFRAFCVNAVHSAADSGDIGSATVPVVRHFSWQSTRSLGIPVQSVPGPTLLESIVNQLAGRGARAHPVWLPPLASAPELSALRDEGRADLAAAIGLIDLPFEQRRRPLVVDTSGAGGNVAIVGAPQTGKSSAVRTLITALAQRHDARRIQFYCLDFGGGSLSPLLSLPHVGVVTGQHDRDLVRRTISQLESLLRSRQVVFAEMRCGSVAEYLARRPAGPECGDPYGDVYLVVDGWTALRDEFGEFESTLTAIAEQGLSVGLHLIITASRWADVRSSLKDLIGTRIELRLGDPFDSEMDRKRAALVPLGKPGCGITSGGEYFTLALPGATHEFASEWSAPAIRLLPERFDLDTILPEITAGTGKYVIGIAGCDLAPIAVDFARHQHLLIIGDSECGKTSALRGLCRSILHDRVSGTAELLVVDYRRGLLSLVNDDDRMAEDGMGYAYSSEVLATMMPMLLSQLRIRLPPAKASLDQLRNRSWWSGPEIYIVVDDYDLVAASPGDPLNHLLGLLPYAGDIGLHLVIARRCAGISRAMYDPLLAQLRETGCMGLMMSGSPDEGLVMGSRRLTPLPPGRGLLITREDEQLVQLGWSAT